MVANHRSVGVADRASSYVVGAAGTGTERDPARDQYQAFLDLVPSDWEIRPLGAIAGIVGGGTPSRDCNAFWNGDIPWVTPGEVSKEESKHLASTAERITSAGLAGSGANLLPIGALMVTTRATLGARAIASVPMATNQGFKSLVFPSADDADFYFYLTPKFKPELIRRASGTTFLEISSHEFARIEVPCPPRQEKHEIARVLAILDTTIRQTEAIIAKLKQVKQGLLHDLLTRGIDANGELRPPQSQAPHLYKQSRLGWIPWEWDVLTLGDAVEHVMDYRGRTPKKLGMDWGGGDILALSANNVQMGGIDTRREAYCGSEKLYQRWMTNGDPLQGDVLLTLEAPLGNVAQIPDDRPYILSQRVVLLRFRRGVILNDFAFWQIISEPFQQAMVKRSTGTTATGIQRAQLVMVPMLVPPVSEQQQIAERLWAVEQRLLFESSTNEKMREQKSGLMDDLLTGRVRVTALLSSGRP